MFVFQFEADNSGSRPRLEVKNWRISKSYRHAISTVKTEHFSEGRTIFLDAIASLHLIMSVSHSVSQVTLSKYNKEDLFNLHGH